ncbi:uncharacterized protein N7458_000756 [Penicillium daleae]|uniref:Uncharacterized protein n=1 Tax=Penicillium daleae TaxID=63821 RepID=A0AAD6G853_9EURO|nr:uncharacterized protein N7458_000756 [Penicillium daleae]KAJ5465070.1 hypothetical protein N7458_000756 [Penicillium daleae]
MGDTSRTSPLLEAHEANQQRPSGAHIHGETPSPTLSKVMNENAAASKQGSARDKVTTQRMTTKTELWFTPETPDFAVCCGRSKEVVVFEAHDFGDGA